MFLTVCPVGEVDLSDWSLHQKKNCQNEIYPKTKPPILMITFIEKSVLLLLMNTQQIVFFHISADPWCNSNHQSAPIIILALAANVS